MQKSKNKLLRHTFSDTLYLYIKLIWTFSLGPDEARSNLSKACLCIEFSPVTEKIHLINIIQVLDDPYCYVYMFLVGSCVRYLEIIISLFPQLVDASP